jgi:mono/diheme cytochrome c family protein
MLRRFFLSLIIAGIAAFAFYWWLTVPQRELTAAAPPYTPNLANGENIFNAGGCASCHAVPKQPDRTRLGGGLAKLDDVRDLFAYLKTLPPVSGKVRDHDVSFPFDIRRNVGIWKLLFMDGRPFVPDPAHTPSWNRGAYLVNSFGHCAECHSPRNFLGGIIAAQRFAGGPNPAGEGWVPNITQKGISDWSAKDVSYFLESGQTPDGDSAGGAMVEVIKNTSQLKADDRDAIAEYLKSLPPVEGPPRPKKKG